jgi:collagen type III alpha
LIAFASTGPAVSGEPDALFERLDRNRDGLIARGDIDADKMRLFERLLRRGDENGDERLTLEEFTEGLNPPEPPRTFSPRRDGMAGLGGDLQPQQFFAQMDRNGDGRIVRDEAPPRLRQNFDRADADGDGGLDRREFFRAVLRRMQRNN